MKSRGFPEMEKLWKIFQRAGARGSAPSEESIERRRTAHMVPWFGGVLKGGAVVAVCAGVSAAAYASLLSPVVQGLPLVGQLLFYPLAALNSGILFSWGVAKMQRYLAHPLQPLMAADLGSMLAKRDYRGWFDTTPKAQAVQKKLAASGVTGWDDPGYRTGYHTVEGKVTQLQLEETTHHGFIQQTLRSFLGYLDAEKKKFVPGRYFPDLLHGKASINLFLREHGEKVKANALGNLSPEESNALLYQLAPLIKKDSSGAAALERALISVANKSYLPANLIEARIWQRDPWRDLTHQEEFFSSASLRGVKLVGRSDMGRLGTFGYLRNKSISALDFSTSKGRVVRARIAASFAKMEGRDVAALFVDGVEGSNAIKPAVVRQAIEDYARSCGFSHVLYNAHVHNQIPKRFIRFLKKEGVDTAQVSIQYLDDSSREYLDAFLWPMQPFEYQYPRGTVIAHAVNLKEQAQEFPRVSFTRSCLEFVRLNFLTILVTEVVAGSSFIAFKTEPRIAPWLIGGAVTMAAVDVWHRRRSLRQR